MVLSKTVQMRGKKRGVYFCCVRGVELRLQVQISSRREDFPLEMTLFGNCKGAEKGRIRLFGKCLFEIIQKR